MNHLLRQLNYAIVVIDDKFNVVFQNPAAAAKNRLTTDNRLTPPVESALTNRLGVGNFPMLLEARTLDRELALLVDKIKGQHRDTHEPDCLYSIVCSGEVDVMCARLEAITSQSRLTPTEARVLQKLVYGLVPKEISRLHGVALSTVRSQVKAILQKTGERSAARLVATIHAFPALLPTRFDLSLMKGKAS
ncbi:MAG: LuxR C-terminal-related transcriptional regulator [Burkholderiaceae bacterium]